MKSNYGAIYVDENTICVHPSHIILILIVGVIPTNHVPQLIPRIPVVQPNCGFAPPQQYFILVQLPYLYVRLTTEPILPMREKPDSSTDVIDDAVILDFCKGGLPGVVSGPHVNVVA